MPPGLPLCRSLGSLAATACLMSCRFGITSRSQLDRVLPGDPTDAAHPGAHP